MGRDFYPWVEEDDSHDKTPGKSQGTSEFVIPEDGQATYCARIAVYDDPSVTPRVAVIEPKDIRNFLEEITATVTKLSHEQGGSIPFMIIREVVENYIHAYFIQPTITILDGGNTIRFSDQGPGIKEKDRALEYGTSSATEQMKRYIRGVGSGLPLAQQYMLDKGGSLTIQDNISHGTIVTISTKAHPSANKPMPPAQKMQLEAEESPSRPAFEGYADIKVSERQMKVLTYLKDHESVGPSDLVKEFGGSQPTWSRELTALNKTGFLVKEGQKRYLTQMGRTYLQSL